ncbi:MAG: glycosyltransferase [Vicingaceae bacterium]
MKIGILLSRFPYPLEKGDKLRAFHQIRELSKSNEIYLCAISKDKINQNQLDQLSSYCTEIKVVKLSKLTIFINLVYGLIFTKLPLQVAYFFKKNSKKSVQDFFLANNVDHIYCQLIRVSEYVKDMNQVPKTLDYMDALSRGMERRLINASVFLKPWIQVETNRLKRYEHFIFPSFEKHCIISEQDRDLIVHAQNHEIEIIRNGVDQNYFKPKVTTKEYDLVFTGNMSYPPNIEGTSYLVEKVLPLIWKDYPNINLAIIGANPSKKVKKLASKKVFVSGWVDDMRVYYAKSRIFVAPMLIGTGLQNKLLEAMAMKIPCITTPLANNALKATPNKSVLIANDPEEFKNCIIKLLKNLNLTDEISNNAFKFVGEKYSWEKSVEQLKLLMLS